ncbi:MAG: hypothetical protein F4X66_14240 [Chloroflexi bacterium]|nr:hypothetical protein [Chloroflexota bacterium]
MSQDQARTEGSPGIAPGGVGDGEVADGGTVLGDWVGSGDAGVEDPVSGGALDDGVAPSAAFAEAAAQVVEDVYELRLTALLHQLVRSRGYKGAGRVLGVDPRTVTVSLKEGMSRRVREQVERMLVDKDGGARDRLEEAVAELSGHLNGLKGQVAGLESELREGMNALGETHAQGMRRLEQRLARSESRAGGTTGLPVPAPVASAPPRRRYPDLVTTDPAEDDEDVFADAWELVEEWRGLWDGHPSQGKGLAWVSIRQRLLELEVAMLEDHGLTLPPETEPLRGLDRGAQLNWRVKALHDIRKRRARLELLARLRRMLSLWLWLRALRTGLRSVMRRWPR